LKIGRFKSKIDYSCFNEPNPADFGQFFLTQNRSQHLTYLSVLKEQRHFEPTLTKITQVRN